MQVTSLEVQLVHVRPRRGGFGRINAIELDITSHFYKSQVPQVTSTAEGILHTYRHTLTLHQSSHTSAESLKSKASGTSNEKNGLGTVHLLEA
jgi:hypothetical protein